MNRDAFVGTATFVRAFLRRDRLVLALWIAGDWLLYVSQAVSVDGLYADQAELDKAAASMESNAAFIAMAGPARALDTVGGQVAWQAGAFGAIVAGLMSMVLVGRHTRAEEESGRDELVRAAAVGRSAPVAATMVVVLLANVLLGALVAGSLVGYGLAVAGSVALGLACGLTGFFLVPFALVAMQLTSGVRAAYGITGAVIALAFVLRAVGDVGDGTASWLSPIGWGQYLRAYADEQWWPALLLVAGSVLLLALARVLFERRDIGSGLLPDRPGPARGRLGSTSLAWRLQRGSVVGWAIGMLLVGLAYGSVGDSVDDVIGDSAFSQDVFGTGVDAFYGTAVLLMVLMCAGFTVSSALRPRGEEEAGRAEVLLATALPRLRWSVDHVLVTVVGTVAVVLLGGLGVGASYAAVTGDASQVWRMTWAAATYVPAVLLLGAVARLLWGWAPRLASLGWAALVWCLVVMLFGEALRLPTWVRDVSPFSHLPLVPAEDLAATPVAVVGVVALVVGVAAQVGWLRRDTH